MSTTPASTSQQGNGPPRGRGGGGGRGRGRGGGDRGGKRPRDDNNNGTDGQAKRPRGDGDNGNGGERGSRGGRGGRGGSRGGGRGGGGEFRRDRGGRGGGGGRGRGGSDRGGRGRGGRGGGDRGGRGGRGRGDRRGGFSGDRGGRGGGRGGFTREPPVYSPRPSDEEITKNLAVSTIEFPSSDETGTGTREEDVGMLTYRSKLPGFTATFKQRFSDFLVHEIVDGNVLRFTSIDLPVEAKVEEKVVVLTTDDGMAEMTKLLGDDATKKFGMWLVREGEKERMLLDAREQKKRKYEAIEAIRAKEEAAASAPPEAPPTEAVVKTEEEKLLDVVEEPSSFVDEENAGKTIEQLEAELKEVDVTSFKATPYVFVAGTMDKEKRTAMHKLVRDCFPTLVSDLVDAKSGTNGSDLVAAGKDVAEGDKAMRVRMTKEGRAGGPRRAPADQDKRGTKDIWPATRADYLRFVLYKENKDTMEAVNNLARYMHLPVKTFSYAGTKDKRAITVQALHAYRVTADKLRHFIRRDINNGYTNMRVGNFSYVPAPLHLGDLSGNRFTLLLRYVSVEPAAVETALQKLKETGFVNYYGMQRFGTGDVPTHWVGKALLKQQWSRAVGLMLTPRLHERSDVAEARTYFKETRDIKGTLERMPPMMQIERAILNGLSLCGVNAFFNVIQRLPRNMRLMYVHSYQSYVWNHMVSTRLNELDPSNIVAGDLVLKQGAKPVLDDDDSEDTGAMRVMAIEEKVEPVVSVDGTAVPAVPAKRETKTPAAAGAAYTDLKDRVHIVTEEDVAAGRYKITDLVLPLPGHSVTYPTNIIGVRYKEFMAKDISVENLDNPKVKDFSLPGGYRKVIEMPGDLDWRVYRYNDPNVALVLTDQDIRDKKPEPVSLPDGEFVAVRLSFNLAASTYATMAVRELLKTPTTVDYQKELLAAIEAKRPKTAAAAATEESAAVNGTAVASSAPAVVAEAAATASSDVVAVDTSE